MKCIKCNTELTNKNTAPSRFKKHHYICNPCFSKESHEHYLKNAPLYKAQAKQWRLNNPIKAKILGKKSKKKYLQTKKGKEYKIKETNKRKRNLGFNKLIENDWDCAIDWHHVNDNDVVPIPKYLHRMCYTGDKKEHRKLCNKLINILYKGELKI